MTELPYANWHVNPEAYLFHTLCPHPRSRHGYAETTGLWMCVEPDCKCLSRDYGGEPGVFANVTHPQPATPPREPAAVCGCGHQNAKDENGVCIHDDTGDDFSGMHTIEQPAAATVPPPWYCERCDYWVDGRLTRCNRCGKPWLGQPEAVTVPCDQRWTDSITNQWTDKHPDYCKCGGTGRVVVHADK